MEMLNGVYLVTDRKLSKNRELEAVQAACEAGVNVVQYREKELPFDKRVERAGEIAQVCAKYGVIFIVNDDVDAARACGADGVHLGQKDKGIEAAREHGMIIGISASNVEEAKAAEKIGASYIGFGPVFATGTKKDAAPPTGIKALKEAVGKASAPFFAIGGIDEGNADEVMRTGVAGLAVVSAIMGAKNFQLASEKLVERVEKWI
jgi:thiamine-phosphate pyrophosphorylase